MLKITLSMMMIFTSLYMIISFHPLSILIMILMQTLLTCLITGLLINSYWFSYILFLTFLGGLLILFIYITSIASNEMFKFSSKIFIYFLTFLIMMMIINYMYYNNLYWLNFSYNYEMTNFFNKYLFFNNENKFNMMKLYNEQTFTLMMMMIIYLLITLITVVKISNVFFGPLRIFN